MAEIMAVEVTGLEAALKGLALTDPKVRQGAERGLVQIGEIVRGEAAELAPVDVGTLRRSGYVLGPSALHVADADASPSPAAHQTVQDRVDVNVVVGFGGPSAPYALVQHEKFPVKRVQGKTWKYLETPAKAHAQEVAPTVAAAIQRRLEDHRGTAG